MTFAQSIPNEKPSYRHAYYLFLTSPSNGCQDCYVPLLITQEPLEQIAKSKTEAACVWITTYERDSLWDNPGIVSVAAGDVSFSERKLRAQRATYRYQEISLTEVVHILANPMGTIPISRPSIPGIGTIPGAKKGPTVAELISGFQAVK